MTQSEWVYFSAILILMLYMKMVSISYHQTSISMPPGSKWCWEITCVFVFLLLETKNSPLPTVSSYPVLKHKKVSNTAIRLLWRFQFLSCVLEGGWAESYTLDQKSCVTAGIFLNDGAIQRPNMLGYIRRNFIYLMLI